MKSQFTIDEVSEMLDMKRKDVKSELRSGNLGYIFTDDDVQKITLYDLEKYMGSDHARVVVEEFLSEEVS